MGQNIDKILVFCTNRESQKNKTFEQSIDQSLTVQNSSKQTNQINARKTLQQKRISQNKSINNQDDEQYNSNQFIPPTLEDQKQDYFGNTQVTSVQDKIDQVKQFNQALNASDYVTLINLIHDETNVKQGKNQGHKWALYPQTAGTLAIYYLQILLDHLDQSDLTEAVQSNKTLYINGKKINCEILYPQIVLNLNSQKEDRIQNSLILLTKIGRFNDSIKYMDQKGVFRALFQIMNQCQNYPQQFFVQSLLFCRFGFHQIRTIKQDAINNQNFIDAMRFCSTIENVELASQFLYIIDDLVHDRTKGEKKDKEIINLMIPHKFYSMVKQSIKINKSQCTNTPQNIIFQQNINQLESNVLSYIK